VRSVAIIGAGKIGAVVAGLLARSGDYEVTAVDRSAAALESPPGGAAIRRRRLDIADPLALDRALAGQFAVLSAAPYHLTLAVAQAARRAGAHYLDLTEDVAATRAITALAAGAETAFIPQCGLAPGFVSIVAADLARRFDELHDVRLRVGALPRYPSNALNYNLTWSTDGVIKEY